LISDIGLLLIKTKKELVYSLTFINNPKLNRLE
jgi:hypothetical protein